MINPKDFNYDWQFLKDFFSFRYFRFLVAWFALVPAAVVALQDMPPQIKLPGEEGAILTLALPFTWWVLWLSSLFYVLAWALYLIAGPKFIRRYGNYTAYQAWRHSERWIIWEWHRFLKYAPAEAVDILLKKKLAVPADHASGDPTKRAGSELALHEPEKAPEETWFSFQREGSLYRLGSRAGETNGEAKQSELFWELFGAEASSRPRLRMTVWLLLGVAAGLFLIILVQNVWSVLAILASDWSGAS